MHIAKSKLVPYIKSFVHDTYALDLPANQISLQETREEFEGAYTVVTFPIAGRLKQNPAAIGEALGNYLVANSPYIQAFNVVKGFLNLEPNATFWAEIMQAFETQVSWVQANNTNKIVLEYASPNTNKPLHLGHIRNILVGWSVGQLLTATGAQVHYTQIINDRGIAICKSMLAWKKFGAGQQPEEAGVKGDHFVGQFYVLFEQKFKEEYLAWQSSEDAQKLFEESKEKDAVSFFKEYKNEYFNTYSTLGSEAIEMLQLWESGDMDTRALWSQMNAWVYQGFESTFERLQVRFDSIDYESNTYLVGKEIIEEGIIQDIFYVKDDGSTWIDLTDKGLDQKLVLRADGTSVYITQDIGTARIRFEREQMDAMIYTVGNEQEYHFQVLAAILQKMDEPYGDHISHLSYGMVELPSGKMKSREGTVVDADDLMEAVVQEARNNVLERGELNAMDADEVDQIVETIGMGALKYHMLKVDAKKNMLFNPEESVEMQGQTGPYIQYAFVRCNSILNKVDLQTPDMPTEYEPKKEEWELLRALADFNDVVHSASEKLDPAILAHYNYELARKYHKFNHEHSVLYAENTDAQAFRIYLLQYVAAVLKEGMMMLGIDMPTKM